MAVGACSEMLTITDAQIEALQRSRITAFAPELETQLRAVMPDIADTRLQTGVATALKVAHENRVSDARDLAVLALIVVTHGHDFLDRPEQGWAKAILQQAPNGRDTRIFQIHARLVAR